MPTFRDLEQEYDSSANEYEDPYYDNGYSTATSAANVEDILSAVNQKNEEDELNDLNMSAVELRLEEANCYKVLLNNGLFSGDVNPVAQRVEKKIKTFIREQLGILLGLEIEKAPSNANGLAQEDVDVLKKWALILKKKPALIGEPQTSVVPETKPVIQSMPKPPVSTGPAVRQIAAPSLPSPQVKVGPRQPQVQPRRGPGRPRKIIEHEVMTPEGPRKIKMDVTRPVVPVGNIPGRIPMPSSSAEAEMQMERAANESVAASDRSIGNNGLLGAALVQALAKAKNNEEE